MSSTFYISQSFRLQGRRLIADQPHKMRGPDEAIASAQRMARTKPGSVAYSITGDPEADLMDEPKVLFRSGQLPPELAED